MNTDNGRLNFEARIDDSQLENDANNIVQRFGQIGDTAVSEGERMQAAFAKVGTAIGSMFALDKIKDIAGQVMSARADAESLHTSFTVLLGDVGKADKLFNGLREFGATTPLELPDLAKAAQTLLGFGTSANDVLPILKDIGNISMGDAQKMESLTLAFSQATSAGKLQGQDLLQMINAGFNPLNEMTKITGKSMGELKDEMSKGQISAKMLRDAFAHAAGEGGQFNGMLDKMSKTLQGAKSNLDDAVETMFSDIGEKLEPATLTAIDAAQGLVEHYEAVGKVLIDLVAGYGTYKAMIMLVSAVHNAAISQQIAGYQALLPAEQGALDADLQAAVASGRYSAAKAQELQAIRAAVAAKIEEMQVALRQAQVEQTAAQAAYTSSLRAVVAAKQELAMKRSMMRTALKSGSAEEIEAGRKSLNAAKTKVLSAEVAKNTALKNLNTATTNTSSIATQVDTLQENANAVAKRSNSVATTILTAATNGLTKAWNALKIAFVSNPIGAAITVAMMAITAFVSLKDAMGGVTDAADAEAQAQKEANSVQGDTKSVNEQAAQSYATEKDKVDELNKKIHNNKLAYKDREKALKEMKRLVPAYHASITKEGKLYNDNTNAIEHYCLALQHAAVAEAAHANKVELLKKKQNIELNFISANKTKTNNRNADIRAAKSYGFDPSKGQRIVKVAGRGGGGLLDKALGAGGYYALIDRNGKILRRLDNMTSQQYEEAKGIEDRYNTNTANINTIIRNHKQDEKDIDFRIGKLQRWEDEENAAADNEYKKAGYKNSDDIKKPSEILTGDTSSTNKKKTKKTKKTKKDKTNTDTFDPAQAAVERKKIREQNAKSIIEFNDSLQDQITQNSIDAMQDGTKKETEKLKEAKQQELDALNDKVKQLAEQNRKATIDEWIKGGKNRNEAGWQKANPKQAAWTEEQWIEELKKKAVVDKDGKLTGQTTGQLIEATAQSIEQKYVPQLKKATEEAADAMDAYLQKYGTFEQREQAIRDSYQRKINNAKNEGQKLTYGKQMTEELSKLYVERLKNSINWDALFNNIENLTKQQLQDMLTKLQEYNKTPEFQGLDPTNKKVVLDAEKKLKDALSKGTGLFGGLIQATKAYEQALQEYNDAVKDLQLKQAILQWEIMNHFSDDLIQQMKKAIEEAQDKVNQAQQGVVTAGANKKDEGSKTVDKITTLADAIGQLGEASDMSLSQIGGIAESITNIFTKAGSKIGGIIGAAFSLLDAINKQGIDKFIGNLFENVFGAVGEIFDTFTGGLIDSGNVKEITKTLNDLQQSNVDLETAVTNLTKVMEEEAGAKATETYKVANERLQTEMQNVQKQMSEAARAYSNGFIGIGGKGSANKHINKSLNESDWRRIREITGADVRSAGDLWSLTSEQMYNLATQATDIFTKIKTAGGKINPGDYMDKYIEYWEKINELTDQYRETLTSISFDDVTDGLKDLLSDTKSTMADAKKKVKDYMEDAILKNLLNSEMMKNALKDWYKDFADDMADGVLNNAENLTSRYEGYYKQLINMRDAEYKAAGIQGEDYSQDSTKSYLQGVSQDQMQEANGRLTSIQINTQRMADAVETSMSQHAAIQLATGDIKTTMSDLLFINQKQNEHLEQIESYTSELPEMHRELRRMREKVDTM